MKLGRQVAIASLAVVAAFGVAGCRNPPSAKTVALEVLATLDLPDDVEECMRLKIDAYPQDQLQEIADAAAEGDPSGVEGMQEFQDDLAACNER